MEREQEAVGSFLLLEASKDLGLTVMEHRSANVCVLQMGMKVARWAQQSLLLSLGSLCLWVSVAPSRW